jgi:hypothetical protein
MERYCGYLQSGLRSRVHPWANLNNRILHKAYIDQIDIYYGLDDELKTTSSQGLSRTERLIEGCMYIYHFSDTISSVWLKYYSDPLSILRAPCKKKFYPDKKLRSKIARYFSLLTEKSQSDIMSQLPDIMPSWGKVRIANCGDNIRASSACHNPDKEREMSFVRVCFNSLSKQCCLL